MSDDSDFLDPLAGFFSGDGGAANNTPAYVSAPPDASGGSGSFLDALVPTLTNGLNATLNSTLLSALGGNSSLYSVDAYGNLVPKAAAGTNNAVYRAQNAPTGIVGNISPVAIGAIGVAVLFLVIVLVKK